MMIKFRKELFKIYRTTDERIKFKLFIEFNLEQNYPEMFIVDENGVYTRDYLDKINEMLKKDSEAQNVTFEPVTIDRIKIKLEDALRKELRTDTAYIKFIDNNVIKLCMF